MIPISEIERVIDRLQMHFDNFIAIHDYQRADAMELAIIELKELIPSEASNSRNAAEPK